jgi:hypothetical protein
MRMINPIKLFLFFLLLSRIAPLSAVRARQPRSEYDPMINSDGENTELQQIELREAAEFWEARLAQFDITQENFSQTEAEFLKKKLEADINARVARGELFAKVFEKLLAEEKANFAQYILNDNLGAELLSEFVSSYELISSEFARIFPSSSAKLNFEQLQSKLNQAEKYLHEVLKEQTDFEQTVFNQALVSLREELIIKNGLQSINELSTLLANGVSKGSAFAEFVLHQVFVRGDDELLAELNTNKTITENFIEKYKTVTKALNKIFLEYQNNKNHPSRKKTAEEKINQLRQELREQIESQPTLLPIKAALTHFEDYLLFHRSQYFSRPELILGTGRERRSYPYGYSNDREKYKDVVEIYEEIIEGLQKYGDKFTPVIFSLIKDDSDIARCYEIIHSYSDLLDGFTQRLVKIVAIVNEQLANYHTLDRQQQQSLLNQVSKAISLVLVDAPDFEKEIFVKATTRYMREVLASPLSMEMLKELFSGRRVITIISTIAAILSMCFRRPEQVESKPAEAIETSNSPNKAVTDEQVMIALIKLCENFKFVKDQESKTEVDEKAERLPSKVSSVLIKSDKNTTTFELILPSDYFSVESGDETFTVESETYLKQLQAFIRKNLTESRKLTKNIYVTGNRIKIIIDNRLVDSLNNCVGKFLSGTAVDVIKENSLERRLNEITKTINNLEVSVKLDPTPEYVSSINGISTWFLQEFGLSFVDDKVPARLSDEQVTLASRIYKKLILVAEYCLALTLETEKPQFHYHGEKLIGFFDYLFEQRQKEAANRWSALDNLINAAKELLTFEEESLFYNRQYFIDYIGITEKELGTLKLILKRKSAQGISALNQLETLVGDYNVTVIVKKTHAQKILDFLFFKNQLVKGFYEQLQKVVKSYKSQLIRSEHSAKKPTKASTASSTHLPSSEVEPSQKEESLNTHSPEIKPEALSNPRIRRKSPQKTTPPDSSAALFRVADNENTGSLLGNVSRFKGDFVGFKECNLLSQDGAISELVFFYWLYRFIRNIVLAANLVKAQRDSTGNVNDSIENLRNNVVHHGYEIAAQCDVAALFDLAWLTLKIYRHLHTRYSHKIEKYAKQQLTHFFNVEQCRGGYQSLEAVFTSNSVVQAYQSLHNDEKHDAAAAYYKFVREHLAFFQACYGNYQGANDTEKAQLLDTMKLFICLFGDNQQHGARERLTRDPETHVLEVFLSNCYEFQDRNPRNEIAHETHELSRDLVLAIAATAASIGSNALPEQLPDPGPVMQISQKR